MKAIQARELADTKSGQSFKDVQFKNLISAITAAADDGKYFITVIHGIHPDVREMLKAEGYELSWKDCNTIHISWEQASIQTS